ncbi:MAG: 3'-5' exonuclease [Eubacteriales bacterium]|nr:3'-5' exonuclease [Eubacteriales bacterium]
MFICPNCNKTFSGYPKSCPHCRSLNDFSKISLSPSCANADFNDILSGYDTVIALDTETTGLSFHTDRVIELSCVTLTNVGKRVREDDILIKLPDKEKLPRNIVELTHITDEMLENDGITEKEAAETFLSLFRGERHLIIAHNTQFDMNFLYQMLRRQGAAEILKKCDMLDTLTVFKDRHEYPHRLENAISAYGLEGVVKNSHRAIDDTRALFEVLKAMDGEKHDLTCYINLFGYNQKYGVSGDRIGSVRYVAQPYSRRMPLYNLAALTEGA